MARPLARWGARRAFNAADRLADAVAPGRHAGIPPRRVRARSGVPEAANYLASGVRALDELTAGLAVAGRDWEDAGSILDLACGAGRVLRHVRHRAPRARLLGCDVDAEAIGWARRHLPDVAWAVSGFRPPLPVPDASVDVLYSISLLSHLDEADQDAWLAEVRRVLAPGGVALLSTHGAHAFEQFRSGAVSTSWVPAAAFDRPPLGDDELVYEPYVRSRWNAADMPGIEGSFGLTFHGAGYVRSRWPGVVDVLPAQMTGWQDLAVCRP